MEPLPDLPATRSVSGHHSFNCNGFLVALHCSLSIPRFYECAGNIVNDVLGRGFMPKNADQLTRI